LAQGRMKYPFRWREYKKKIITPKIWCSSVLTGISGKTAFNALYHSAPTRRSCYLGKVLYHSLVVGPGFLYDIVTIYNFLQSSV
jgi:hypothetical protein